VASLASKESGMSSEEERVDIWPLSSININSSVFVGHAPRRKYSNFGHERPIPVSGNNSAMKKTGFPLTRAVAPQRETHFQALIGLMVYKGLHRIGPTPSLRQNRIDMPRYLWEGMELTDVLL